jgi:hypothetical protein
MTRYIAAVLICLCLPAAAMAAPDAKLWPRWQAHDPASTATLNHDAWDGWTKKYVTTDAKGVNRVAYAKVDAPARKALDTYIHAMSGTLVSLLNRNEQMAFWINLYNALTVRVILDHYPVESILKISISPGFFSTGPWGKKLVEVEGRKLSLDDIEHRILRPIWKDARIHYVVNCASVGCPNLRIGAYTGANIDAQLTEAARGYINDLRGGSFEGADFIVSSLYKWYAGDFGANPQEILAHMLRFAAPEKAARIRAHGRIDEYFYDWDLNGTR